MALTVTLNGHPRSFNLADDDCNLASLVGELGLKADRIAVELNRQIVSRTAWPETVLASGDKLEIVHFVGGGSPGMSWSPRIFPNLFCPCC